MFSLYNLKCILCINNLVKYSDGYFRHETQFSTNQIASATTKDINKLKSKVSRNDKQKQLQVEKLEENFCDTINKYYRLQKVKAQ